MSTELTSIRDLQPDTYYRVVNTPHVEVVTAGVKDEETGEYLWDKYQIFSAVFVGLNFVTNHSTQLFVKRSISVVIKVLEPPFGYDDVINQTEPLAYCKVSFVYPDKSNFLIKQGEHRINSRPLLAPLSTRAQPALDNFINHGIVSGEEGRTYEPIDLEGASSEELSIIGSDLF